MRVVLDAQLLAGYFREAVVGEDPFYSGPVVDVVKRWGRVDVAFVDEGGIIEQEYRNLLEDEWFEAWYGERLETGDILIFPSSACPELIKTLKLKFGFPANSKDRHYVGLARALAEAASESPVILSEDLDFYDPKAKGGSAKQRARILAKQAGPVARHLAKCESILVRTVAGHLAA